jgi:hypothetical protein
MSFAIKYFYQTGNSFGRHDEDGLLDLTWEKKENAQDNLRRIREHYEYYKAVSKNYYRTQEDKAKAEQVISGAASCDWFVKEYSEWGILILKTDSGKDLQIQAPWCGYFERLHSAEIIEQNSLDKITFS